MIKIAKSLKEEFNISNLCLAGGVALNCVANGKILKEKIFDNIWVQPAAGDAGGSLGAALALWYIEQNNPRTIDNEDSMQGSYLGPEYLQKEIEKQLDAAGAKYEILKDEELLDKTATDIANAGGHWLVSGKNGIWTTCTRWKINFRRPEIRKNAKKFEFESKI
jgi:carbamoyltransferase